jgi:alkanesulfonate monooxygenase SsuD/methylene tetrahydromethanopterin reductase-like flavin-dependent oxidoreductase (luciferase family)
LKTNNDFASKHREAMFLPSMTHASVRTQVGDIRASAVQHGRNADSITLIVSKLIIVDETNKLAQYRFHKYLSHADFEGSIALGG